MQSLLYAMVFAAGAGLAVQTGLNAALRAALGSTGLSTLINFLVGVAALCVLLVATGTTLPQRAALASAPAWAWFGGLLGAFYVACATIAGPRVGAGALLALTVLGQLAASLTIDHYGLIGFPRDPLTPTRLAGAALLLTGVWLIARR